MCVCVCVLVYVYNVVMPDGNVWMQVDTLLNEAELEAEITSVKQRLTSQQLATLSMNADTFPGNC